MKASYITFFAIVSTLQLAAQSCPSLTQTPAGSNVCTASATDNYWYYFLGDETDTYAWSVIGGTIVYGGGIHDWWLNVVWTPGAPYKQIAVEKWTQWGAYCSGVLPVTCTTTSEALNFSPNSRVGVPDANGSLNLGTGSFTLEAYVKTIAHRDRHTILSKRTYVNGQESDGFWFGFYDGQPCIQLKGTTNIRPQSYSSFRDGKCHHVAVRRSGTTISFFMDGIFVGNGDYTSDRNISSPGPLNIGADIVVGATQTLPLSFEGWIGEIRIWNYARTDAQIQSNLGSNLSPQTGLIAYYDMKDLSNSQTLSDMSGNNKHGTLGGSSSVDSFDPTWLSPTQVSCRVSGNFRLAVSQISQPIEVDSTMDISTNDSSIDTKVFPNPTQNFVTVELREAPKSRMPVVIYDLKGTETHRVYMEAGEKNKVIDIAGLGNGIFILRIIGAKTLFEKKLIILKE